MRCLAAIILLLCSTSAALADTQIRLDDAKIFVHSEGQSTSLSPQQIENWVRAAAETVSEFYGRFPVDHVDIYVRLGGDGEIGHGVERNGKSITIRVGDESTPDSLASDWMLTHEMIHLGFPDVDRQYQWMNEGLAVFVEPIARTRRGILAEDQFWRETVAGMRNGLPAAGDRGLDNTPTWGRTYWGGAMFWLLADVRIREATKNQKSVDDVARAILKAGGNGSADWKIEHIITVGDEATGTTVLKDLHDQMGGKSFTPDPDDLWKRLGVRVNNGKVTYDDGAPLANIRKAMVKSSR